MGNMHLVTGYAGQEHITATDQGAFNAALIGRDQFVLDVGNVFAAQVISNNQVRILDGELMMQGRFVRLNPDTYVDLTIENGAQGKQRHDLVVARYTKDSLTGVEGVDLAVIKGTAVDSNPADPAYTKGDITNGAATLHDFPLWRIPLDGLNVGEPVALFGEPFMDSMRTLPDIRKQVNQIHKEVDAKIEGITAYTKEETLTSATKTLFGLDESSVPNDAFQAIRSALYSNSRLLHWYTEAGTFTFTVPHGVTRILAIIVGGGGGGGAFAYSDSADGKACGGMPGYVSYVTVDVTDGQEILVVVGAGGTGAQRGSGTTNSNYGSSNGGNGGTSSFNGATAVGGSGGNGSDDDGQSSDDREDIECWLYTEIPFVRLGVLAGGSSKYSTGGKSVIVTSGEAKGGDASGIGSGGGGATSRGTYSSYGTYGGNGSDGAVLIYEVGAGY